MSKAETKRVSQQLPDPKVSGPENSAKTHLSGNDLAETGNIDKIREILFGTQTRDLERKILRLEERLLKESSDLRDELKKRFESLEMYTKKEIESLTDRLKAEQVERAENLKEMSRELKEMSKALEKKLGQLDEQGTKSQRDLRQQILDQSKSLSEDIRQKIEAMSGVLNREVQELRYDKTDRSALADLFTEFAVRMKNEFKLPSGE